MNLTCFSISRICLIDFSPLRRIRGLPLRWVIWRCSRSKEITKSWSLLTL
jgi:hypothetical protein